MSLPGVADERWIGRTIDGRYRIVALLGDGGMGSVYEAEHLALAKRVALKVIHPELVRDEEALARFEREARATAAIDHPHVASAMDFGRLPDGGAYLVVRLVSGGLSIRTRVEGGPLPWREACVIGAQIADALAAIHARGFVHRDLTSDNVLLTTTEDGSPFAHVLDLGVAGLVGPEHGKRLTEEGHVVGTPGYMSPEQALGQPTDPRADLYSLGVLLWEMCCGRSLFGARELTQIVAVQLTDDPPPIPQLASATAPSELALLIQRLLARAPADRPSDANAVRDALRRFAAMSSVVPVIDRFGVPAAALAGAGAIAVVALMAVVIAAVLFSGSPELAKRAGTTPVTPPASVAPPRETLSPALASSVDRMLHTRWRAGRRAAAEELRASAGVPEWALAVADLELATECSGRQVALQRLARHPARAALPAIERFRDAPRTGCGRGRRADCYACVREDIERAYRASMGAER